MSELSKLLEGVEVEWKALGEVAEIYGGLKGKSKNDFTDGNAKYVPYKNIFYNIEVDFDKLDAVKVASGENQYEVKYGDVLFTGSSEIAIEAGMSSAITNKSDFKVYLNSFSFGLRFNTDIEILPEFSKYLFRSHFMRKAIAKTANGVTRFNISKKSFKKLQIPIPSLKIKKEIVRILDTFTQLTTELTTELTARKKQYSYYREQLLSFPVGANCNSPEQVEWKTLGDVTSLITKGTTPRKYAENGIAFIKTEAFEGSYINSKKLSYIDYDTHNRELKRSILKHNDILITIAGATIGKCVVVPKEILPANTNQALAIIRLNENVNLKYIFYLIKSHYMAKYIELNSKGSAQPNLNLKQLNDFPIPIPSNKEQERIVAILDKFDTLTTSISEGLPKEIELRKKQYEYYREMLLTFPK